MTVRSYSLHPPCYGRGICIFLVSIEYEAGKLLSEGQGGFVREKEPSEPRVGEWAEPKIEEPQETLTFQECDEVITVQSPLVLSWLWASGESIPWRQCFQCTLFREKDCF